jgi:glycosyltransferase involved in cell wall biosynthesis
MTERPKLSICIATFNRASFIVETLDSIVPQLDDDVELVVVDGASSDETPRLMAEYTSRYPRVRYLREPTNSGVDADYDRAVGYARGEFCWLMTDDDLMLRCAVSRVRAELSDGLDLLVVNSEVRSRDFSKLLKTRTLEIEEDLTYRPGDEELIFRRTAQYLSFIGAVVVRRSYWLARDRAKYYGSHFIHVGVLFQRPAVGSVKVLAGPALCIRFGNASWAPRGFVIWMKKWPELIWSFDHFSEPARREITARRPYHDVRHLLAQRALGTFSVDTLDPVWGNDPKGLAYSGARMIAKANPKLMNAVGAAYYLFRPDKKMGLYNFCECRSATWFTRLVGRYRLSADG